MWSPLDAVRARRSRLSADELWWGVVASCLVAGEMRRLRYEEQVVAHPRYREGSDLLDQERGELRLGALATAWAQVLGRALPDGRWRWAWADDTLHRTVQEDARALKDFARRNGLGTRFAEGTTEGIGLDEAALVGTMFVGADGFHLLPQEDGSVLVVLVRHTHLARQPLPYDRLPGVMWRLLAIYGVSHDMVLHGWRLYEDGLRFEERADGTVVAEATSLEGFQVGRRWVVERDPAGSITRVGAEDEDGRAERAEPLRVLEGPDAPDLREADPTDAWRTVVSRSALAGAMRQARFEAQVLEHPARAPSRAWTVDVHDRVLEIEGAGSFDVQALGALEVDGSWSWGWADPSLPQGLTWASADLRDSIAETAVPAALTAPRSGTITLREAALVGVWQLDADGYYVAADAEGRAVVFVLWHEGLAGEGLPYDRLPSVVGALLAEVRIDHRELLAGWKASRPPGLELVDEDDGGVSAVLVQPPRDAVGHWSTPAPAHRFRVRLDDEGRIARVDAAVAAPPGTSDP